ncbi:4-coumarate--CoA ligase-like 5 [Asimina triloba]
MEGIFVILPGQQPPATFSFLSAQLTIPSAEIGMAHDSHSTSIDPRSGFCGSNSTFYSKRKPLSLPPPHQFLSTTAFISSRKHSGTVALIDAATGRRLTYPELWRAVDAVATSLSNLGVRKGHVILLLSPNSIYFPIVCLSVMSLGAIITTTNPLNTPQEIAKQIADSNPLLAFTTRALAHKIHPKLPLVLLHDNDGAGGGVKVVSYIEEMMKQEPDRGRVRDPVAQDDTATLLYSSGTTGMSKGVASSHRNLIATVETIIQRFSVAEEPGRLHTMLCTVPMFHIYGLAVFATGMLALGYAVVVLSKFEMHDMLSAIARYQVSYLPLVPPILVVLTNNADAIRAKYEFRSLKKVLSGGAPLSKEVIEGFLGKFPAVEIMQGYGLTETMGVGASTDTLEESRRYGTAGLLSPNMEAKIVDTETGEAVGVGKTGELWLRGPSVMKGKAVR